MDSGLFLGSKRKIISLSIGPALILTGLYLLSSLHFKSAYHSLKERQDLIESVGIMDQKIAVADIILDRYRIKASPIDTIDILNEQLNNMARRADFTINSLRVEKASSPKLPSALSIFNISVKGEGRLSAIIKFFNQTYTPGQLFTTERADLKRAAAMEDNYYNADFTFSYYAFCEQQNRPGSRI